MDGPAVGAPRLAEVVARVHDPDDPLDAASGVALVGPSDLEAVLHGPAAGVPTGAPATRGSSAAGELIATGLAASPGAAQGTAVFDAWRALDAVDEGFDVILVRTETSPADEPAMSVVAGVLTSRGGLGSHAAVIARGRGLPAVCGAHHLDIGADSFATDTGAVVHEGDVLVIDGSSGEVRRGEPGAGRSGWAGADDALPADVVTILGWADRLRGGRLAVQANADGAADAARARRFGAEGIGLCRTEHQFLAPERLVLLRRIILASSPEVEAAALDELVEAQRADFTELLAEMDGLVVTVRLLDPPLHEFLPDLVELERGEASGSLDAPGRDLLAAARRWHEHNPMLGVRGVRLAVLKPALYRMQVRALVQAAAARRRLGGDPRPQVMVPLVAMAGEVALVRSWLVDELADLGAGDAAGAVDTGPVPAVGAMIETPRAALVAGALALEADFLSFGTNDLTQLTFGLSRDDAGRVLDAYRTNGLMSSDPFATLDPEGVGALIGLAADAARAARPGISLGVCGEHGGDPDSIARFVAAGLDYVSCSPFRVPVARLAAAQATMASGGPAPTS